MGKHKYFSLQNTVLSFFIIIFISARNVPSASMPIPVASNLHPSSLKNIVINECYTKTCNKMEFVDFLYYILEFYVGKVLRQEE